MDARHRRIFAIVALCLIAGYLPASAQTVQLQGTISPDLLNIPTFGDAPPIQTMPLQIWLKPSNQARLKSLLAQQQNPKSPQYHKWITPQEYSSLFGPSEAEFNKLSHWLTNEGFRVTGGSPAAGFIGANGNIFTIGRAFNTQIKNFSADGSEFGNLVDPQLPSEYGSLVSNITGLDNLNAVKPMVSEVVAPPTMPNPRPQSDLSPSSETFPASKLPQVDPEDVVCLGSSCFGPYLGPSDFYTFYDESPLSNAGITGTDCIAIIGLFSNVPTGANGR